MPKAASLPSPRTRLTHEAVGQTSPYLIPQRTDVVARQRPHGIQQVGGQLRTLIIGVQRLVGDVERQVILGAYLHEPEGAVIRARLIGEVARMLGAGMIDAKIAYLTSDAPARSTPAFDTKRSMPPRPM